MALFSIDVQRRVRLRHATKFDLSELLGEKVVVYVGELPQSEQERLLENMELRELVKQQRAGADASQVDEKLAMKALKAQQQLIAASLLDERGDRLRQEDVAVLFDLIPATAEGIEFTARMLEAVYGGLTKNDPAPAVLEETPRALPEAEQKPGK